jgi:DNA-binding transcriptional MerR regulator
MPFGIDIPDKGFFKIGEVARIVGVKPFVLRYWETEFDALRPEKSPSGQRTYSRQQVELIAEIRHLVHVRRFTIEGARKRLRRTPPEEAAETAANARKILRHVVRELEDLLRLVER